MSNIQFNLLPDIKMTYVQATRTKSVVVSIAVLVSIASIAIMVILFFLTNVVQKAQLNSSSKSVTVASEKLKKIDNIESVLTIQNQLKGVATLHKQKHITSRLFVYLPQVTPTSVHINQISLDLSTNTLQLSGTTDSQQSINTFIDTLKFTTFKVGKDGESKPAFTAVVETGFSLSSSTEATYSLTANVDPLLFSNDLNGEVPILTVPKLTTTRSVVQDPSNPLFNGQIKAKQ